MSTDVVEPLPPQDPVAPSDPVVPAGSIFGLSLSRIVALATPYISMLAASIATWLFVHFPGLHVFGSEAQTARLIVEGAIFLLVAFISYAMHHKWLDGLSKWERGVVSDMPGDQSHVMPIMPPADFDLEDGTGEDDDPDAGGKGMPLGWDPNKKE